MLKENRLKFKQTKKSYFYTAGFSCLLSSSPKKCLHGKESFCNERRPHEKKIKYFTSFFRHIKSLTTVSLMTPRRYQLSETSRCNVTLLTELQAEDDNRRWRCQVTTGDTRAAFLDFTSSFVFQEAPVEQSVGPSVTEGCPVELPVSRILLCVALPLMVSIVGFFTWKSDHKKEQRSAADIELHEVFWPSISGRELCVYHRNVSTARSGPSNRMGFYISQKNERLLF